MTALSNVKAGGWIFIFAYLVLGLFFQGSAPTLQQFEYTFQRPIDNPGTLQTQRWGFFYWVTALYTLIWIVPITLGFALDDTHGHVTDSCCGGRNRLVFWRQVVHTLLVALLLLWFVATFIYGLTLWGQANSTSASNYFNPANDPRWCGVYYNLENHDSNPSFPCYNTAPMPGVDASMLVVNPAFLYQLWFSFVFIVLMTVDLLVVGCAVKPVYEAHARQSKKNAANRPEPYRERLLPNSGGK